MKQLARSILRYAMHLVVGTMGIIYLNPFIAGVSYFLLAITIGGRFGVRFVNWIAPGAPYFPVQIISGLCLGYLFSNTLKHKEMIWIWIAPLAYLTYAFLFFDPLYGTVPGYLVRTHFAIAERLSHFFGEGCPPKDGCFDQMKYTAPFYASTGYSLGALLAQIVSTDRAATKN